MVAFSQQTLPISVSARTGYMSPSQQAVALSCHVSRRQQEQVQVAPLHLLWDRQKRHLQESGTTSSIPRFLKLSHSSLLFIFSYFNSMKSALLVKWYKQWLNPEIQHLQHLRAKDVLPAGWRSRFLSTPRPTGRVFLSLKDRLVPLPGAMGTTTWCCLSLAAVCKPRSQPRLTRWAFSWRFKNDVWS